MLWCWHIKPLYTLLCTCTHTHTDGESVRIGHCSAHSHDIKFRGDYNRKCVVFGFLPGSSVVAGVIQSFRISVHCVNDNNNTNKDDQRSTAKAERTLVNTQYEFVNVFILFLAHSHAAHIHTHTAFGSGGWTVNTDVVAIKPVIRYQNACQLSIMNDKSVAVRIGVSKGCCVSSARRAIHAANQTTQHTLKVISLSFEACYHIHTHSGPST